MGAVIGSMIGSVVPGVRTALSALIGIGVGAGIGGLAGGGGAGGGLVLLVVLPLPSSGKRNRTIIIKPVMHVVQGFFQNLFYLFQYCYMCKEACN